MLSLHSCWCYQFASVGATQTLKQVENTALLATMWRVNPSHRLLCSSLASFFVPARVSVQTSCRVRRPAVCSVHALICTVSASSTQSGGEEAGREEGRYERRIQERKEGKQGLHSTQLPTLPPTWLEANSHQMPDVPHYTWYLFAILENLKEFIALHWIRCSHSTLACYKMMSATSELMSLKCPILNLFSNVHAFHCYIPYVIIQNNR